ncbi:hypothetical protein TNCV_408651 [Trichonephila clavipes]|nr:hypothetical protein TNCV_408651 [Trichonephila clavipes]
MKVGFVAKPNHIYIKINISVGKKQMLLIGNGVQCLASVNFVKKELEVNGLWSGREKKKEKWDDKKRVENREGSLGYPEFVTPMFTKDSKPLGKGKYY